MSACKFLIILSFLCSMSSDCNAQQRAISSRSQKQYANRSSVTALAFSRDGKVLAVGRYRSVALREIGKSHDLTTLNDIEGAVTSVDFGQRENLLAVATGTPGRDGIVDLWDWKAGRRLVSLKGHNDLVYCVAIRPDGHQLAAAGYDRLVSLWNLSAGTKLATNGETPRYLRDHTDSVYGLAYSPDGRMLATVAGDRTVKVWDTQSGKRLFTLSDSTAELYTVAFRPDGKQIAAGGVDRTLRVWTVNSQGGILLHSAFAHKGAILKIVYSHDGQDIFTGGEDNAVKQWNAETLEEKAFYPGQPDWPHAIAVSPNDKLLAVGRYDGSLALYDTARHQPIVGIRRADQRPVCGAASPPRVLPTRSAVHQNAGVEITTVRRLLSQNWDIGSTGFTRLTTGGNESFELGADRRSDVPSFTACADGVQGDAEVKSQGENESLSRATAIPVPCTVIGTLWNHKINAPAPGQYYRFHAKRGQILTIDVLARRAGSPLDSEIEILDLKGEPVERALLRAVSQTEITLSDRDSASPGIRLLLRPEFRINDYVLMGRELNQIYALPKGPDDDYLFRNYRGQRTGFLGTTPEFHTVGGQVYKVEVHPSGTPFSPNGMPLTHLFYRNDDGGGQYGRDSYLEFTPPADGEFFVRLGDVRGQQGEHFTYRLRIHAPRPDFNIVLNPASIAVPKCGAVPVTVECERNEGFNGEIAVRLEGLPPGFTATEGTIEAGESSASLLVLGEPKGQTPKPNVRGSYRVVATALIGGKEIRHTVEPDEKNRPLSVGTASNVQIVTDLNEVMLHPGEETVVEARITRLSGIKNRIPLDIRNLPFGMRVVDIGLNGVLINEQETTRKFTLHCDAWVKPQTRLFYVTATVEGGIANTAPPLTLHITPHPR